MIFYISISKHLVESLDTLAEESGKTLSDLFIGAVRMAAADQLDLGGALNARRGRKPSEAAKVGYYLAKKDADVPFLLQQLEQDYHLARADVARLVLEAYIAHLKGATTPEGR